MDWVCAGKPTNRGRYSSFARDMYMYAGLKKKSISPVTTPKPQRAADEAETRLLGRVETTKLSCRSGQIRPRKLDTLAQDSFFWVTWNELIGTGREQHLFLNKQIKDSLMIGYLKRGRSLQCTLANQIRGRFERKKAIPLYPVPIKL